MCQKLIFLISLFTAVPRVVQVRAEFDLLTGNKSIPLVLNYIYYDSTTSNRTFAGGQLPLRDIVVDMVNRNHSVLPHYHVTINALRSRYLTNTNIGITIEMFLNNVIGTGDSQQQHTSCMASEICPQYCSTKAASDGLFRQQNFSGFGRTYARTPAPLFFGPELSAEARVISQVAPRYNLVGISSTAVAADLADRSRYPNFYRTQMSSRPYVTVPRALLTYLNYTTVALGYLDGFLGADLMQSVETDLRAHHFKVLYKEIFYPYRNESEREFARNAQLFDARVFVMQSNSEMEYKMFCHAMNKIGHDVFTAENYIFIHLMLVDSDRVIVPERIDVSDCTFDMLDRLQNTSFAVMTPTWDYSPEKTDLGMTVAELREQLLNLSRSDKYGDLLIQPSDIVSVCANSADMFWTGLLALDALDKRLRSESPVPRSLLDFTFKSADIKALLKEEITKVKFRGASGPISFTSDGSLAYNITINQYIAGEGFHKRFTFDPTSTSLTIVSQPTFATLNGLPPPDKKPPPLPADEASARNRLLTVIIVAVVAVFGACSVAIMAVYFYHKRTLARSLAHPSWMYDQDQLKMRSNAYSQSSMAGGSIGTGASTISLADEAHRFPTALLNGSDAVVKLQLISHAAPRLQVNEKSHKVMTAFRDALTHVNVVRFIGYSRFAERIKKNTSEMTLHEQYLIWEHCEKGSLEELIANQVFKLDATFEFALLLDVAGGMAFLHNTKSASVLGQAHGKLNPAACLIDRRFSVKVACYGEQTLAALFGLNELEAAENDASKQEEQLYWAPELLRLSDDNPRCSKSADVYAFAMTMYSLITRLPPYESESELIYDSTPTANILELVRNRDPRNPPMRPTISADIIAQHDKRLLEIMQRCWSEEPNHRPAFKEIVQQLRSISNVKGRGHSSVTDQLLSRLERYASDMESLVAERTIELAGEKRRSDELLNRMLPAEIVEELKKHGQVQPEAFDSVSIYFSDIVGFTTISSTSTPIEIVNLLNSLYTLFDAEIDLFDVYKVETIGDAYMVVSGLPRRNGDQHAGEIARLSLALLAGIQTFVIPHRPSEKLMLRIGLHTGPCVAGVVGIKMPRYCLFGDTVNTASRMESNGAPLQIHISDVTKLALDKLGGFRTNARGYLDIKGKGSMNTHWLLE